MNRVYVSLGSNLGNRHKNLRTARNALEKKGLHIPACSSIYETEAWGLKEQSAFLNQVIELYTDQSAIQVLHICLETENEMGRQRKRKWGARLIDIDILYYENQIIDTPQLQVPHTRIPERRFVLVPLSELAPGFIHPILQKSQDTLLKACNDELAVEAVHFQS